MQFGDNSPRTRVLKMKLGKRIVLFVGVNILIIGTLSIVMSLLGVQPYLTERGINYSSLMVFCALWGFGGAFVSLALSRVIAKWMMGVKIVDIETQDPELRSLVRRVHNFASQARIKTMPEVGIYESEEINAFATGPTRNRSLVAVSTGLLRGMKQNEIDAVLAHEIAHISNGDMVTMTLVQGVVNVFVMFLARVVAFLVSQFVEEERRGMLQFGVIIALEILLGMLGMIVVAAYSRRREYRADEGGASMVGQSNMIAALEKLKSNMRLQKVAEQPALSTLKISGKTKGFMSLFSTHPDLDLRIANLRRSR